MKAQKEGRRAGWQVHTDQVPELLSMATAQCKHGQACMQVGR